MRGKIYFINKRSIKRGKITQPAIVISNDTINKMNKTVQVIYLTTNPRKELPTNVRISGLNQESYALCEQIHTISKDRLGSYIKDATIIEMREIELAINHSLGLNKAN